MTKSILILGTNACRSFELQDAILRARMDVETYVRHRSDDQDKSAIREKRNGEIPRPAERRESDIHGQQDGEERATMRRRHTFPRRFRRHVLTITKGRVPRSTLTFI